MRIALAVILSAALLTGCSGKKEANPEKLDETKQVTEEKQMTSQAGEMPDLSTITFVSGPEGLEYHVMQQGTGEATVPGRMVEVHYTGWFPDGKKFDSSRDRGQYFSFPLGQGRVIRGWDLGVAMMKVGDRYLFKLPPEIAYGARGAGGVIPPNATLIFDVEVFGVK